MVNSNGEAIDAEYYDKTTPYDEETVNSLVPYGEETDGSFGFFYHKAKYEDTGPGTTSYFTEMFRTSNMNNFKQKAYDSPGGAAIRVNPITGEKEMFIAGSRTGKDIRESMTLFAKSFVHAKFGPLSQFGQDVVAEKQADAEFLIELARENGVKVVYGHSAGSVLASYFPQDEFKVIGINGATRLHEDRDIVNIRDNTILDMAISKRGTIFSKKKDMIVEGYEYHDATKLKVKPSKEANMKKVFEKLEKQKGISSKYQKDVMKLKKYQPASEVEPTKLTTQEGKTIYPVNLISRKRGRTPEQQMDESVKFRDQVKRLKRYERTGDELRRLKATSSSVTKKNHKKKHKRKSKTKSKKGRSR